ncbi:MAG TPA: hypothetical protein PKW30_02130 [Campylobacterales bacterium]|nr:hypothetical protein [Campylobacterales bacterium]
MQDKMYKLAFFVALASAVIFAFRVRQSHAIAERYKINGRFCWRMFVLDLLLQISLALVGFFFTVYLFELTPLLVNVGEYKYICAVIMGVIAEHGLPILLDTAVSILKKKSSETVEKI